MKTGENIHKRSDGRFEARYIKSRTAEGKAIYGSCYAESYEAAKAKRNRVLGLEQKTEQTEKHMNILILGHGDHGCYVASLCDELRMFEKISFLDDQKTGEDIIGKCDEYGSFLNEYPVAYPGFGDNELRKEWFGRLRKAGFIVPILVHPTALVSQSAKLGAGTIVEARATVNAETQIGEGCIISTNTTVDVSSEVGEFTYTAPGITIMKRTKIAPMSNVMKMNEGTI